MPVTDVMHIVAVKIHIAAAGRVFDVNTFGLHDGVETRGRDGLPKKIPLILGQQLARRGVKIARGPRLPLRRLVSVAFRWRRLLLGQRTLPNSQRRATLVGILDSSTKTIKVLMIIRIDIAAPSNTSPRSVSAKIPTGIVDQPGG